MERVLLIYLGQRVDCKNFGIQHPNLKRAATAVIAAIQVYKFILVKNDIHKVENINK